MAARDIDRRPAINVKFPMGGGWSPAETYIELSNPSTAAIDFKVMTNIRDYFNATPNSGSLLAGESVRIVLRLVKTPNSRRSHVKFLLCSSRSKMNFRFVCLIQTPEIAEDGLQWIPSPMLKLAFQDDPVFDREDFSRKPNESEPMVPKNERKRWISNMITTLALSAIVLLYFYLFSATEMSFTYDDNFSFLED